MRIADAFSDEVAHAGAAGLGERLTGRPAGEDVDIDGPEDLPDLVDVVRFAEVPLDRHTSEVVRMGLQRFGVEVGTEDDPHPGIFKAKTHSASAREQIGRQQAVGTLAPQLSAERHQLGRVGAVLTMRRQPKSLASLELHGPWSVVVDIDGSFG